MNWEAFFTTLFPAITTLVAGYYGARYGAERGADRAYELQRTKESDEIKRRNIAKGNIAIFNILMMANTLENYQRQNIDPIRNSQTAFLDLRPTLPIESGAKLNIETLGFLLETDDPNLLGFIAAEKEKFQTILRAINERARCYKNEVQPLLEKAGIFQGRTVTLNEIWNAIGDRLYATLEKSTEDVISLVDDYIKSHKEVADRLTTCLKKLHPGEKIIGLAKPGPTEDAVKKAN